MPKNDRIVRIDDNTIGLILEAGKLLVIENNLVVSMGIVPEEKYFIHPIDIPHLAWETQIILNAVMIAHEIPSPFVTMQPSTDKKTPNHL